MTKITISIDDETHRKVRIAAANRGMSISAMVREYVAVLAGEETEFEKLRRMESQVRAQIGAFRASDRLSRDELHERKS